MMLALLTIQSAVNAVGGLMLLAGGLAVLLTTPRRAEQVRQRRTINELHERVGALEDQLREERTRRVVAETAATAARERADHVEAFAVGRAALDDFLRRLDRLKAA